MYCTGMFDLKFLFLEEDAVSAESAILDKYRVEHESVLIDDTKWPILVKDTKALATNISKQLSILALRAKAVTKAMK